MPNFSSVLQSVFCSLVGCRLFFCYVDKSYGSEHRQTCRFSDPFTLFEACDSAGNRWIYFSLTLHELLNLL